MTCPVPDPPSRYVPWARDPGVSICRDCGALVTDTAAHDGWHRRIEPAPDRRRF